MFSNVPPEDTKGNTVSIHTDPSVGEIVNTLGVGFIFTVIPVVFEQGSKPVDWETAKA